MSDVLTCTWGGRLHACHVARPSPRCHPDPARASCERCEGSALRFALQLQPCRNAAGKPLRASLLSSDTALIPARTLIGVPEKSSIHALGGFHRSAPPLVHPIRFRISKDQRAKGGQIMEKRKSPVLENIVRAVFPHRT